MKKSGKSAVMQSSQVFGTLQHVDFFRHLSNHIFRNLYFPTYISYEGHLFFSKCLKIDIDFGNGGKISQKIIHLSDNCI